VGTLLALDGPAELRDLDGEPVVAAQPVDRPVLRRGHQPTGRVLRHAASRPLLQGGDQGVLRQLLGEPDIAHQAGQRGDDAARLQPPHRRHHGARVGPGCWHGQVSGPYT
jgi:hypothetical protein